MDNTNKPLPDNSLYLGFEYKSGQEYGIANNVLVLRFNHLGMFYNEIISCPHLKCVTAQMFTRVSDMCLTKRTIDCVDYYDFAPDADGAIGWTIG